MTDRRDHVPLPGRFFAGLLCATALAGAASSAAAAAAPASPADVQGEIAALRAQMQALEERLGRLQGQIAAPPAAQAPAVIQLAATPASAAGPATTIEWRGSPEFSTPEGFRFKVRGRFQYDVGYVENPEGRLPPANFGFNSRSRRIRLGVEGWFPGDIQYKAEMDFANAAVAYGDVILFWQPKGKVYSFGLGNYDTFQNMEQPSSSRYISFLERSAMIEAFDQNRHVGVWMGLADPKHDSWRFNLGLFGDRIRPDNAINGGRTSYGADDWMIASRALYTPKLGKDRLHFGVHYQRRQFQTTELSRNYQTRPFTATTDQRFVSTGAIAAHGDQIMGVEAAAILGSFHAIAEAQQTKVDVIRPGEALAGRRATTGKRYNGDPTFTGWYGEVGYFLTGERRGYRNGLWDRTKVLHPVGQGGIGAIQLNARYDHLNLDDRLSGAGLGAPDNIAGGKQSGVLFSTIWQPMDYVRFTFQYTHAWVEGGPRAAVADPDSAPTEGKFSSDLYLARAQFDF